MGLITKNIRGVRKQIEDMGVLGNPGKYTMVAAENEEFSPWESMHVEHGFQKEDSTITLTFPQSFQQMVPFGTDDKGILATVINSITPARMGVFGLVLTPAHAKSLADSGWTKKKIKDYIIENARVPMDQLKQFGPGVRGSIFIDISEDHLCFWRIWFLDGVSPRGATTCHEKSRTAGKLGYVGCSVQEYRALICPVLGQEFTMW